jgi:hypothetical protein
MPCTKAYTAAIGLSILKLAIMPLPPLGFATMWTKQFDLLRGLRPGACRCMIIPDFALPLWRFVSKKMKPVWK